VLAGRERRHVAELDGPVADGAAGERQRHLARRISLDRADDVEPHVGDNQVRRDLPRFDLDDDAFERDFRFGDDFTERAADDHRPMRRRDGEQDEGKTEEESAHSGHSRLWAWTPGS
jgi:hypothetical protein